MGKKLKVYLDTSVISALFDKRNPDRQKITQDFFRNLDKFEVYISELTVQEIASAHKPSLRERMQETISSFNVLEQSAAVRSLAAEYVKNGAVPEDQLSDAEHIAFAVMNEIGYLLSWNFQHILRMKTRDIVRMVNTLKGLAQITILTPGEIL